MLLIEEPEAHLHPQWQLAVMDYLQDAAQAGDSQALQVILTTHSPVLASHVKLKHVVVVQQGAVFPLAPGNTKLDVSDYRYLERFLDSTRANLFFARGVIIVEGDAEALLLPAVAEALGRPLSKYGVSIVNVGSTGLFRYAKIFQRLNDPQMKSIAVACVADLDPSDGADDESRAQRRKAIEDRYNGGPVSAFVAHQKTLEYDLVFAGLGRYMFRSISLSSRFDGSTGSHHDDLIAKLDGEFDTLALEHTTPTALADAIYAMVKKKKAPTAQILAQMLLDDIEKKTLSKAQLVSILPRYILDALSYVTGGKDIAAT
jgi:putative ATP-dependent endonuclease of the OLD family